MAKRRPKDIGTEVETALVKVFTAAGWANTKRLALEGVNDRGDISLGDEVPVTIEAKGGKQAEGASDGLIQTWLAETERERIRNGHPIGVLILKRKGVSGANAHRWTAIMMAWQYEWLRSVNGTVPLEVGATDPIRFDVEHLVSCLRNAGYGS